MYEELVERLRRCEQFRCRGCEYENVNGCRAKVNAEAANAIEGLIEEDKELSSRAEYIEREKATEVLCDACGNAACPKGLIPRCSYYEKMHAIPAADVVEVVRCKNCKHWRGLGAICNGIGIDFDEDGYCCEGEMIINA